ALRPARRSRTTTPTTPRPPPPATAPAGAARPPSAAPPEAPPKAAAEATSEGASEATFEAASEAASKATAEATSEATSEATGASQGARPGVPKRVPVPTRDEIEEEPASALRLRLTSQEVLMLHAARKLVTVLDGRRPSDEHFWSVLLAESMSTLTDPKSGDLALASVPPIDESRLKTLLERGLEEQRRREAE